MSKTTIDIDFEHSIPSMKQGRLPHQRFGEYLPSLVVGDKIVSTAKLINTLGKKNNDGKDLRYAIYFRMSPNSLSFKTLLFRLDVHRAIASSAFS